MYLNVMIGGNGKHHEETIAAATGQLSIMSSASAITYRKTRDAMVGVNSKIEKERQDNQYLMLICIQACRVGPERPR